MQNSRPYSGAQAGTNLKVFRMFTVTSGEKFYVTKAVGGKILRGRELFDGIVSSHHASSLLRFILWP